MENPVKEKAIKATPICGFWTRFFALLIDFIVLGLFSSLLAFVFLNTFVRIDMWARFIGFAIASSYFGILNSSLGNGQTIGKKIMKIRVVDRRGKTISFIRSFARATILITPCIINRIHIISGTFDKLLGTLFAFAVFGLGIGIIYLYVFNGRTRQSLHDLVAKTLVVKQDTTTVATVPFTAKIHYLMVGIIIVIATLNPNIMGTFLIKTKTLSELKSLVEQSQVIAHKMKSLEKWNNMRIQEFSFKEIDTQEGDKILLSITALTHKKELDAKNDTIQTGKFILLNYPKINNVDFLQFSIVRGFDMGIISWKQVYSTFDTQANWRSFFLSQKAYNPKSTINFERENSIDVGFFGINW
jgi:uncharacterized RDD family membrane protein YckC